MKIGILGHGFIEWGGGLDFLRMIAGSLVVADPDIELHFFFPIAGPRYQTRNKLRLLKKIIYKSLGRSYTGNKAPNSKYLDELISSIGGKIYTHIIDMGMDALRQASKKYQIDILLPSISPLKNQTVPWIGYLYDYQHTYYPEFFTSTEIADRNKHFRTMLASARHVIVNAQAVADDIKQFNPESKAKIISLPFSAAPSQKWLKLGPVDFNKYDIKDPYFIICNQFWQHKDHKTAWRAFSLIIHEIPNLQLVCTGEIHDYRNPNYFAELMDLADELGIKKQLKILGLIPKDEQIRLLRNAVALVQPTLFEGGPGGGAVFDAVSLGVPCIVSDIKVNLELNESAVEFFKSKDSASLANKMIHVFNNLDKDGDIKSEEDLIRLGADRRRACGKLLLSIINPLVG
jgi:glycosyltransferase involved in cell wall biosynthesis